MSTALLFTFYCLSLNSTLPLISAIPPFSNFLSLFYLKYRGKRNAGFSYKTPVYIAHGGQRQERGSDTTANEELRELRRRFAVLQSTTSKRDALLAFLITFFCVFLFRMYVFL